jgi:hypothetical protein
MNKRGIQAFSLGIIFTVSILGSYYFYFDKSSSQPNISEAKSLLKSKGYTILTQTEYLNLKDSSQTKATTTKKQQQSKASAKDQSKKQTTTQNNDEKTYQLQVTSGMASGEIANLLAKNKIIENAMEFEQYLITHQYETKVQLGTYILTTKMDYEQLAKIITKSE